MAQLVQFSILVVEDEPEIRKYYKEILETYVEEVHEAGDGTEALALYERHRPDILFMDINLPGASGLEVVREIRRHDKKTRIVIISAHSETPMLLEAVEMGLTRYIVKPIQRTAFKEALQKATEELEEMDATGSAVKIDREGDMVWDPRSETLILGDQPVKLTKNERRLLGCLMEQRNGVCSFEAITFAVWPDDIEKGSMASIKMLVRQLRSKLGEARIESVYGEGYRLRSDG
jgi:DNA-binding response OmpR family regulator